jgi:hypothetical protein
LREINGLPSKLPFQNQVSFALVYLDFLSAPQLYMARSLDFDD